jgi:hypothetical protein
VRGYQSTFEEYVESLRNDNANDKQCHGSVNASLDKSAVSSLWDEVRGAIEYSNAIATSFLSLFGIEDGNGLSTLITGINEPSDLRGLISQFFKSPKPDDRGRGAEITEITANYNANNNTPNQVGVNNDEVLDNNGKDEDDNVVDTTTALLPEMIASHVSFINECTSESVTDNVDESIRDEEKDECEVSPYMNGIYEWWCKSRS